MFGSTTPFGTGAFGSSTTKRGPRAPAIAGNQQDSLESTLPSSSLNHNATPRGRQYRSETGAFGGQQSTPFGQSGEIAQDWKKYNSTSFDGTFGTPGFGAATPAFGASAAKPTGGLFGGTSTGTSLFGQQTQPTTGFSFGANTGGTSSGGLFQTPQTSNVFGQNKTTTFGGFGSSGTTSTGGSLFGGTTTTPFGGTTGTSGGLFGSTGFGQSGTSGTTVKFNPVTSSEQVQKNGLNMMVQTKHQCITVMKEYESKSMEELRLEDYAAGRKTGGSAVTGGGLFGTSSTQGSSLFGTTSKPAFGATQTGSGFGGFGASKPGGLFSTSQSQTGGLFGKTTGTATLFGTPSTSTSTFGGFGTSTGGGLFGQTSTAGQTGGLFGTSQPSGLFGTTQTTSSGGLFGTSTFGATPQVGSLFGAAKPFNLGQTSGTTGFGTSTFNLGGTSTGTGLFGSAATTKPTFTFNTSGTSTLGTGTGLFGSGGFGTTTGLGGGLFGSTATSTTGGLFGQNKTGLGTGIGFGTTGGLGTGIGGTTGLGGLSTGFGGQSVGLGLAGTQGLVGLAGVDQNALAALQQQQIIQQQLKALANSPFGDSPLFRNLSNAKSEKPTLTTTPPGTRTSNAAAHYKVFSRPSARVKPRPISSPSVGKSKLFEGLEDDQELNSSTLVPRASIKKLVIRNKSSHSIGGDADNSLLRLRSLTEDDDDLIAPVPDVPTSPEQPKEVGSTKTPDSGIVFENERKPPQNFKEKRQSLDNTIDILHGKSGKGGSEKPVQSESEHSDTEEESTCNITLERSEYYTIPSRKELNAKVDNKKRCIVNNFIVGREGYGEVKFIGETDVFGLNLDEIVFFRRREVEVYPDNYPSKPEVGNELNKRAEISLHKVWPNDKSSHTPIKSPDRLRKSGFVDRIEEKTMEMGAVFLDYRPDTGTWVFQVDHFTRYGLKEQMFTDDEKEVKRKFRMASEKILPSEELDTSNLEDKEKERHEQMGNEEIEKEKKRIEAEIEKEKKMMHVDAEGQDSEMEDSDEVMIPDTEVQEDVGVLTPSSYHHAKVLGVDAQRLQGMKAHLFDEEDEQDRHYMNPREQSLLASKSVLSTSFKDTSLKSRFVSPQRLKFPKEKLGFTYLVDKPAPKSPAKIPKTLHLFKSSFLNQEKGYEESRGSPALLTPLPLQGEPLDERQPKLQPPCRKRTHVPVSKSVIYGMENLLADAALANGRRFRVGWGPKLRLIHNGLPVGQPDDAFKAKIKEAETTRSSLFQSLGSTPYLDVSSTFAVKMEHINITPSGKDDSSYMVDCLKIALRHCKVEDVNGAAPLIQSSEGVKALHEFSELTKKFRDRPGIHKTHHQHAVTWDLVRALWGRLDEDETAESKLSTYDKRVARRDAVSKWLSLAVEADIKREVDSAKFKDNGHLQCIFSLLSGRQISAACKTAYQNKEYRLALLLSQAAGDHHMRHLIRKQLSEWEEQKADKYMDLTRLKIYQLLSGMMVWRSSQGMVNVCKDVDWKRAFAIHLWYFCSTTTSLSSALEEYRNAFKGTDSYGAYAAPPRPFYTEEGHLSSETESDVDLPARDVCYHLIQLFCKRGHKLENLLSPDTHTANLLDYQLSWHLQQILESLDYTQLPEAHHCLLQSSFAAQLESIGLWEWAVFVLMHIKNGRRRTAAVREILMRHCRLSEATDNLTDKERFLIDSLELPPRWIHEAKALHAQFESRPYEEAVHLLKAGHWNASHMTIVKELASDSIIDEEYISLKGLLLELAQPERCCMVKNWALGGQIYLDYISLKEKLAKIEKGEVTTTTYQLEDFQTEIASLMNRISSMTAETPKERLCQSDMARTCSNLLKIVLGEMMNQDKQTSDDEDIDKVYTWPTSKIAPYIAQLPLPPDYCLRELRELVPNFASEISEQ